jgi:hypothetical protein
MLIGTVPNWAKPWFAFICVIPTILFDADSPYTKVQSEPLFLHLSATASPLQSVTTLVDFSLQNDHNPNIICQTHSYILKTVILINEIFRFKNNNIADNLTINFGRKKFCSRQ